jgi:hypothetical protein
MVDFPVRRGSSPVVGNPASQAPPTGTTNSLPESHDQHMPDACADAHAAQSRRADNRRAQGALQAQMRRGAASSSIPWIYREPTLAQMQARLGAHNTVRGFNAFVDMCVDTYPQTQRASTPTQTITALLHAQAKTWCDTMGPGMDRRDFGHYYPDLCVAVLMNKLEPLRAHHHETGDCTTWVATNYIGAALSLSEQEEKAMALRFGRTKYFHELVQQLGLGGAHMALLAQTIQGLKQPPDSGAYKTEFKALIRLLNATCDYVPSGISSEPPETPILKLRAIVHNADGAWDQSEVERFVDYVSTRPKPDGSDRIDRASKQTSANCRRTLKAFRQAIEGRPASPLMPSGIDSGPSLPVKRTASQALEPPGSPPSEHNQVPQHGAGGAQSAPEEEAESVALHGVLSPARTPEPNWLDEEQQPRDDGADIGDIIHKF